MRSQHFLSGFTIFLLLSTFLIPDLIARQPVAIFFALSQDIETLRKELKQNPPRATFLGTSIERFSLDQPIISVKVPPGCALSAAFVSAFCSTYKPFIVFSIGPAGGLNASYLLGSWHQVSMVSGYQRGTRDLIGWKQEPAATIPLSKGANTSTFVVASGETFCASTEFRDEIRRETKGDAVDMTLFGIATACNLHHIPLIAFRVISDHADEKAVEDFNTFVSQYDGEGARRVLHVLDTLPPDPESPESYKALKTLLQDEQIP